MSAPSRTQDLQRQARIGAIALSARTAVVQVVVLAGQVILARRLEPQHFGVFAIVQFTLTFLTFFGDGGLGAALVQKKEEPTQIELSSVFGVQLGIGAALFVGASLGAPLMQWIWPDLPANSQWVLRALALNFFLTSLRVVPSILMERHMQFVRIAILDAIGSVMFYGVASGLALADLGIWALVGGVLAQGVTGLVLAYVVRPYRPSLAWSSAALKPLLKFGVTMQAHHVVGLILSAVTPLFGGRVLGAHSVGFINWAQGTAHFPLQLVNIISRTTFPLYSRLQDDRPALRAALGRSLRMCALGTMLFVGCVFATAPKLVAIVYSEKWLEALPLLYIYAGTITFGFFAPVMATLFEAVGRPGIVLRLAVIVTASIWAILVPATLRWGTVGFASAYVSVMVLGNIAMLFIARRVVPGAPLARSILPSVIGGAVVALLGRWLLLPIISGPVTLVGAIVVCVAIFAGAVLLMDRQLWRDEVLPLWLKLRARRVESSPPAAP